MTDISCICDDCKLGIELGYITHCNKCDDSIYKFLINKNTTTQQLFNARYFIMFYAINHTNPDPSDLFWINNINENFVDEKIQYIIDNINIIRT
jgi:hypothetical protein